MRHHLFDDWLKKNKSVDFVLENLEAANFDPEFYAQCEKDIITNYNKQTGKNIKSKSKRGIKSVFNLLSKK